TNLGREQPLLLLKLEAFCTLQTTNNAGNAVQGQRALESKTSNSTSPLQPLCSLPDPTIPFCAPPPLTSLLSPLQIVCSCRRRNRGKLDLFSSQASYQPMNEYPTYHTHGRFSGPGKKQNPYSDVSSGIATGNGTNAFYTNPATSDNL
uniref:Uncharacterized protein n=1 Tax=Chrysemys picta bellii TaxID=8478 RepID=A0A8C3PEL2_CHRPI